MASRSPISALVAAATLSNRYISDRFLPDKAIDLVDEACAMIRTEMDSMPTELDEISRKIIQHEIEEAALKKGDRSDLRGASEGGSEGAGRDARQVQFHEGKVG